MEPTDERAVAGGHAPRFAAYFRVRHYEADAIGHVNNAAYLHYLEQAAVEHSAAVGYPLARYRKMSTLFIVRRHGQVESNVGTVAIPADRLLPTAYVPASEPLVRARTQWVYVDLDSGRPLRIPAELIAAFMG